MRVIHETIDFDFLKLGVCVCDNCDSDCESFVRLLALLTSEQVYVKFYARVREPKFLAKGPF